MSLSPLLRPAPRASFVSWRRLAAVWLGWWAGLAACAEPSPADSDLATAIAQFQSRRYAEAETLFKRIATEQPRNAQAQHYLGALALRRGNEREALDRLDQAIAVDPDSAATWNTLGDARGLMAQRANVFAKLGWAQKCVGAYRRAVELAPDSIAYRESLMNFYAQAPALAGGGMDKAFAVAEDIGRLDPLRGWLAQAGLKAAEKKWPDSFALLDRVLGQKPDHPEALFAYGRLAALSGQNLEAGAAALRRYLQQPPADFRASPAVAQARLGNILEKQQKTVEAHLAYAEALRLDPNLKMAREGLSRVAPSNPGAPP